MVSSRLLPQLGLGHSLALPLPSTRGALGPFQPVELISFPQVGLNITPGQEAWTLPSQEDQIVAPWDALTHRIVLISCPLSTLETP